MSVVILLADGVRPDTLTAAIASGAVPALAALREEGGPDGPEPYTLTSCFPSVTGPAYAPFLMGRYPGPIGLPGLRWFDRAREVCSFPDYSRSYMGYQMKAFDRDIAADAPTIFELADSSLGALNMIGRGLAPRDRIGSLTLLAGLRAARTHFTGNLEAWLQIDRDVADQVVRRVRDDRPAFTFAALVGIDKVSHARGQSSPMIVDALRIVDETAARIRADAERDGRWDAMSLWVLSDHGHSRVTAHEDLARIVQQAGYRTMAHPWVFTIAPEVGVMVSGNAMAHLYLDLRSPTRRTDGFSDRWRPLADLLLSRPSVDLLIRPTRDGVVVSTASRGCARLAIDRDRYSYIRESGDPLGIGTDLDHVTDDEAYDTTLATDYPDSVVQITHLATAPRSGEIILSAARDWDFRARYEPMRHVSSHGALHREHMLVPLLLNRRPRRGPRRTVDIMPSALAALGKELPGGLDGRSFL